jgi:hypothetical protein
MTPGISGAFFGLDAATLATLQSEFTACVRAIAVAGQSYTIAGRQFNRANLPEVTRTLAEINAALARVNNTTPTQTYARFSD